MPPALHDRARAWQRPVYESGFAGIHWPVEYGGRGLDRSHTAVWSEECAKARVQPYLNLQGLILAGEAILRSGTEEQKTRYLPATLSGDTLWCQLFSEPDAGSDLASLATTAVRDGDHYVLNGQKVWWVLGDELMSLLVRGHALRAMLLRSGAGPAAASASKLLRTELEFDAELLEATLRGAEGMSAGEATDRMLYAPGMKIAGGSSEIQRNIIGERLLGLPREPRA